MILLPIAHKTFDVGLMKLIYAVMLTFPMWDYSYYIPSHYY